MANRRSSASAGEAEAAVASGCSSAPEVLSRLSGAGRIRERAYQAPRLARPRASTARTTGAERFLDMEFRVGGAAIAAGGVAGSFSFLARVAEEGAFRQDFLSRFRLPLGSRRRRESARRRV